MARIGARAAAQYFPTPLSIMDTAAGLFEAPARTTLYDPSAGTGLAVARLAERLNATAYGNELDAGRAADAGTRLAACTVGPYESVERVSGDRFSCVFSNPPYDDSVYGARLETRSLGPALEHLAAHGALLLIVPVATMGEWAFLSRLQAECDVLGAARFPAPEYAQFRQGVLWAVRRGPGVPPSRPVHELMVALKLSDVSRSDATARALPEFTPEYVAGWTARHGKIKLPGHRSAVVLTNTLPDMAALRADATSKGATTTDTFRLMTRGRGERRIGPFQPLLPLSEGHAAELLAAGMLDGAEVTWQERQYLVRGFAKRTTTQRQEQTSETSYKIITRERFSTVVVLLDLDSGAITELSLENDKDAYTAFLLAEAPSLTAAVRRRFPAIYDPSGGRPGGMIDAILDQVHAPGRLPGVDHDGLLPKQRDVVTACAMLLRSGEKTAIASADMGTGKTLMGAAIFAASEGERMRSGQAKAVVAAPAHLTPVWKRELAVTLREFGMRAFVCKTVSQVDAVFALPIPAAVILSNEALKQGSEWRHAATCTVRLLPGEQRDTDGEVTTKRVQTRVVLCPTCGHQQMLMIEDEDGELLPAGPVTWTEDARDGGRRVPEFGKRRTQCQNSECNEPLWTTKPYVTGRVGRRTAPRPGEARLETALAYGGGRIALARYIAHRYPHRYTLIGDEMHKYKGLRTDQGFAIQWLESGARKVIGLTGTIYGGKASTLYMLGFRFLPAFREQFDYAAEKEFVYTYGLVETTEYRSTDGGTSSHGYNRSGDVRVQEIPGAQPEMIALLLPYTAFIGIDDMGVALPKYTEYLATAPLPDAVQDTVRRMDAFRDEAKRDARRGDTTKLSLWASMAFGWPYKMEGAERLVHRALGEEVFFMPGCQAPADGWPLDQRLVAYCLAERARGRRVLVFLEQMIRRDSSPRLGALLRQAGLQVGVLRPDVAPEEREAWVNERVRAGVDVLMTSSALVETGLTLLAFPSIAFFGLPLSTYRVKQSSRRSYRLGQMHPVDVSFWAYEGSLTHTALTALSKGLRAVAHVNGRLAEGLAASAEDEDGDLMSSLMRQVMTGSTVSEASFPALPIPTAEEVVTLRAFRPIDAPADADLPAQDTAESAPVLVTAELAAQPDGPVPATANVPAPRARAPRKIEQTNFLDLLFAA